VPPLVTADGFNLSPEAILACALVGILVGIIGVSIRHFLLASAFELGPMLRGVGAWFAAVVLRHRPGGEPTEPWFCRHCRSQNLPSASRCYSCHAQRSEAAAAVPDAEAPAGPSAGLTQRRG
jgi:hypothetical protein